MRSVLLTLAALLAMQAALPTVRAKTPPVRPRRKLGPRPTMEQLTTGPFVRLGKKLPISLTPSAPLTPARVTEIRGLISALADIDSPDFGLSPSFTGSAFAPVAGIESKSMLLLGPQATATNPAFRKLVEYGPESLPFLLDALDNPTPTRLKVGTGGALVHFVQEVWGNPMNASERKVIRELDADTPSPFGRKSLAESNPYAVTVGDACFVAVGQIVGRSYSAVRYQPSGLVMINSPSHDPKLAAYVRKIWSGPDPRRLLFETLLTDYATEGIFNGASLDGWDHGAAFQTEAALRLLYYFPKQFAPVLAARLRKLHVESAADPDVKDGEMNRYMERALANGVRLEEFIPRVAWSRDPEVRKELLAIFRRTGDSSVVLAALPAVRPEHDAEALRRLRGLLERQPADEGGPFGEGYRLLIAMTRVSSPQALVAFRKYLEVNTVQRRRTTIHALRETRPEWAVSLLAPLLNDKRTDGWTYAATPHQNEPRLPIRVCDEAAETLSLVCPDLKFEMVGSHENLDDQIAEIRKRILPP